MTLCLWATMHAVDEAPMLLIKRSCVTTGTSLSTILDCVWYAKFQTCDPPSLCHR